MLNTEAKLNTENGSRYLQQLCKHFAHKFAVEFTPTEASLALPTGPARLRADEATLWIALEADDTEGLDRAKHIIDKHLERFAFREEFAGMPWQ